jgi:hypothetical protein
MALFYVPGLLLITKHGDDSFGRWYLHAQELLSYDSIEFIHEFWKDRNGEPESGGVNGSR